MARFPNFIGSSYEIEHATVATERCVNWYPAILETPGAKAPEVLLPTPGVEVFVAAAENPVRALFTDPATQRVFTVIGDQFYEVESDQTLTARMSAIAALAIDIATDPATISSNGDGGGELFITSGGVGYLFTLATDTLTQVVASGCDMGAEMDGYFIYLDRSTSAFFISGLTDGTDWDPLAFQQPSRGADRWVAMTVEGGDLFLHGTQTTEVWYNAGTSPFPFALNPTRIPFGIAAPWSSVGIGGTVCWVGQSVNGLSGVVRANGTAASLISTGAIASALQSYMDADAGTVADANAETHEYRGHAFYLVTFPTANVTWTYDLLTQKWHQRGTWDSARADYDAWRPLYHCVGFGKHLVGDRAEGVIYELRGDFPTDVDGVEIRRVRRAPVVANENRRIRFNRFELDLEVGLGNAEAPGDDPQVTLQFSNDAGKTWASAGSRSAGALGQYGTRVFWTRLGTTRNRVFEVVVSDPINNWRLTGAYLEATPR
jgi:hypothetical protein